MAVQKKPDKQVQDKKEPEVEVPVDPTAAVRDGSFSTFSSNWLSSTNTQARKEIR